jgi:hypothetical protein
MFRKIMVDHLENTVSLTMKRSLSSAEKLEVSVELRFLRVLGEFVGTSPFVAVKVLGGNEACTAQSLVESVFNVIANGSIELTKRDSSLIA